MAAPNKDTVYNKLLVGAKSALRSITPIVTMLYTAYQWGVFADVHKLEDLLDPKMLVSIFVGMVSKGLISGLTAKDVQVKDNPPATFTVTGSGSVYKVPYTKPGEGSA